MSISLECAQLYSLDVDLVVGNASICTSYYFTRKPAILMHLNKVNACLLNRTSTSLKWVQLCCTWYQPTKVYAQRNNPIWMTPVIMPLTSTYSSVEWVQLCWGIKCIGTGLFHYDYDFHYDYGYILHVYEPCRNIVVVVVILLSTSVPITACNPNALRTWCQ